MKAQKTTTIAAIATGKGRGGIGVVRISGPLAREIGTTIVGKSVPARTAVYAEFRAQDGAVLDVGVMLFFQGPNSFTGEDIIELQGHGGPVVLDSILQRALELGAVLAKPGEFSERAFLNNKIDLAQAEAIAAIIEAQSSKAAKAAVRSLQGEFSKIVHAVVEQLIQLRQQIEASIDFSEEDLDLFTNKEVGAGLIALRSKLEQVSQQTEQGVLLAEGVKVVIVGQTNVGKSSLLNLLTKEDAAIVTELPGTTRDLLKANVLIDGISFELIDTAGLRETNDVVEREGIRRAWQEIAQADVILLVVDSTAEQREEEEGLVKQQLAEVLAKAEAGASIIVVYNKIDLLEKGEEVGCWVDKKAAIAKLSAKTGAGKDRLIAMLKEIAKGGNVGEEVFVARKRHLIAIEQALACVNNGIFLLQGNGGDELLAEELRQAQALLGEITGEFGTEELLGRIFSEFCVGK